MHSRTIATLDQLEKASWFSRVGINEGSSAAAVTSWTEAIAHCDSSEWENLQGEALNQYCVRIAERSRERLSLWNETVDEVKELPDHSWSERVQASLVRTISRKYSRFGFVMISPVLAWKPDTRMCALPASSRALATGTSTDTFPAAGGARFRRESL
jgi:hypothetical protein